MSENFDIIGKWLSIALIKICVGACMTRAHQIFKAANFGIGAFMCDKLLSVPFKHVHIRTRKNEFKWLYIYR